MLESLHTYATTNPEIFWLVVAGVCLVVEVFFIPAIGFLFAGFAALTLGGMLAFKYFDDSAAVYHDLYTQIAWFFGLTVSWAILLWYPLKRMQKSQAEHRFNDMVGTTAFVGPEPLIKGKTGTIRWSGTTMRGRLDPEYSGETVEAFTELNVVNVNSNIIIVRPRED
ncbi:MAG: hypothetical protein H6908_00355 [Hyphomicrobiales bacterium]|nr:hypothetical protein [Rickettsiales bacterium]MCP5361082.1 hypothetical protein [Hyphomicrobiales bacterium]